MSTDYLVWAQIRMTLDLGTARQLDLAEPRAEPVPAEADPWSEW